MDRQKGVAGEPCAEEHGKQTMHMAHDRTQHKIDRTEGTDRTQAYDHRVIRRVEGTERAQQDNTGAQRLEQCSQDLRQIIRVIQPNRSPSQNSTSHRDIHIEAFRICVMERYPNTVQKGYLPKHDH